MIRTTLRELRDEHLWVCFLGLISHPTFYFVTLAYAGFTLSSWIFLYTHQHPAFLLQI